MGRLGGELHFDRWQRFFEPHDVWPQGATARGTFRRDVSIVRPARNNRAFVETFCALDVAVQFDDSCAAGELMQAVHVLCDEMKAGELLLHLGEHEMSRIWLGVGDKLPPPFIPFPNEFRIAFECARRGQFFRTVLGPQPGLSVTECRHTALG